MDAFAFVEKVLNFFKSNATFYYSFSLSMDVNEKPCIELMAKYAIN